MLRARFFTDFHTFFGVFAAAKKRGSVVGTGPKTGGFILGNYFKFCRRATPLDHGHDDDDATKKRVPFLANFRARIVSVRVRVPPPLQLLVTASPVTVHLR